MSDSVRFSLIEVDDRIEADNVVAALATPTEELQVPEAEPVVTRGVTIDEEGAARSLADEEAARAAGFSPAPPVYTVGTMVLDVGVENFKQMRQEFDNLPTVTEACQGLVVQVQSEERRDQKVKVPTLTYGENGYLQGGENCVSELPEGGLPLSERAFEGLCNLVTPGGGAYLRNCGQVGKDEALGLQLRAANMNHWFPRAVRLDKRGSKKALRLWAKENAARLAANLPPEPKPKASTFVADQEINCRIRRINVVEGLPDGAERPEEIFAVTGPRYSKCDVDEIAGMVDEACGAMGGRCTVLYNGYKAQIDILFHSNIVPENAVAGEFFKAGIRITTADDGTASIKVQTLIWRNLCLNFMIIDCAKRLSLKKRHVGEGITAAVLAGIEDAKRRMTYFSNKWSEASLENVLERYGLAEPEVVFERLVLNKVLHVPGYTDKELVDRLMIAYRTEPGWGKTAYVNAITKAAHHHDWRSIDNASYLEEKGGELLFQKVWQLDAPPEGEAALLS